MNTFIQSIIAKSMAGNRRNALILLALTALVLLIGGSAMLDTPRGPQPFDQVALIAGSPQDGFVDLPFGGRLIDTPVRETTTTRSRRGTTTRTDYYRLLPIGDRYLIVQSDSSNPGSNVIGEFMNAESDFDKTRIIPALERAVPAARGKLMTNKLYSNRAPSTGAFVLGGLAILVGLLAWQASKWIGVARNPAKHPLMASLAKSGDAEQLATQINNEVLPTNTKPPALTANWLVTDASALRMHDAMWAYINPITNGKTRVTSYFVQIWDRHGNQAQIATGTSLQQAEEWFRALQARAPWMTTGTNEAIAEAWKKDRPGFLAQVDARR